MGKWSRPQGSKGSLAASFRHGSMGAASLLRLCARKGRQSRETSWECVATTQSRIEGALAQGSNHKASKATRMYSEDGTKKMGWQEVRVKREAKAPMSPLARA